MRITKTLHLADTPKRARALANRARKGEIVRVMPKVYVEPTEQSTDQLVIGNLLPILEFAYPEYALGYRCAISLQPDGERVYLVGPTKQQLRRKLGPLAVHLLPGNAADGVEPCLPHLRRMTEARVLLESLAGANVKRGREKFLTEEEIEGRLVHILDHGAEVELNALRDEAREYATTQGLDDVFSKLDAKIGALLSTHSAGVLQSVPAQAYARREPFDQDCLKRCQGFADYLAALPEIEVPYKYDNVSWRNVSFFEAYFSNYIEGTEMTVAEAEQVAFRGQPLANRQGDSHDVMGTFAICSDFDEMSYRPDIPDDFVDTLKRRHRVLLAGRPNKRPGEFKEQNNQAGNTIFVSPANLEETLSRGFSILRTVSPGFRRALLMHFLVTDAHPMEDGNGRLGRLMMNAELVGAGEQRILVPNVARDDYLNGQRHATNANNYRTVTKVLYQLQRYTDALPAALYDDLLEVLENDGTFMNPDQGAALFNRARRQYRYPEATLKTDKYRQ